MLTAIYNCFHYLNLEDLWRDTAWSTVYYGNNSVEDQIISGLSHFKRICSKFAIQLKNVYFWNNCLVSKSEPYLFIVSYSSNSLKIDEILDFVHKGSNLVVIAPPIQLVSSEATSFQKTHENFLESLHSQIGFSLKEVQESNFGLGKIFYINNDDQVNDLYMEPGPYGGFNESQKAEKEQKIESLIKQISTFNVPCLDCQIRSIPACWPQDQALVIEIELIQRSSEIIEDAVVMVEMPSSFEPLSTIEIQVQDIRPNSKRSLAVLAIPRSQGIFRNPLTIRIGYQQREQEIFLPDSQIEIISNLPDLLRSSRPTNIDLALTLPKYEAKLQPLVTSSTLIDLLNIDPDAVVAKVRKVGEHICKSIARKHISNYSNNWTFAVITKQLFDASILNSKAKGYIDTIRIFGNMAAHSNDVDIVSFDYQDALSICYALVLFLKEVTENNLI
jgi:hypothetical protein